MKTFDEQWKPVNGFENYEISNLGRVKSLNYNHTGVEKILKSQKDRKGYLAVSLCRDGKVKKLFVHRLVATAFLPNPEGLPEVNHRNEDKTNNCVSNIEWCSRLYNNNYGSRNEKVSAALTNNPARSKPVEASKYSDFREIELFFASVKEAKRNGYNEGAVYYCCKGCYHYEGNNKYKNLYWRFAK